MPFNKSEAKKLIESMIDAEENISSQEKRLRKIDAMIEDGKPGEALKLFDDTLLRKADLKCRARTSLGEIWLLLGKHDKAEKSLREAIEADCEASRPKQLLARLYSTQGQHEKAIAELKTLSAATPSNISSLNCLGNAYVDAERHDEAKEVFGKIKELDDDSDAVNDGLGKIAFKEGDMTLAAKLLQETRNGEELARFFNNLAISYVAKGDFPKGIETYENAIKMLGDKASLHLLKYNLGLAYRKKGQLPDAFSILAESYLLEPSFTKAYAALAKLAKEMKESGLMVNGEIVRDVKRAKAAYDAKVAELDESADDIPA
jgi:tetratricopeptide (TPR) repeat protein